MNSPRHRRQINAKIRGVKCNFHTAGSIVGHHGAMTTNADQELMAFMMRMLSPQFLAGHAEDQEISKWLERNLSFKFPSDEVSSHVFDHRKMMEADSFHLGELDTY